MPANKIAYRGIEYDYRASKDNILTYITQPKHHYDDWTENGGILIVKYEANHDEAHQYYVLHQFRIFESDGYIEQENLHEYGKRGGNRYAEVVESNK